MRPSETVAALDISRYFTARPGTASPISPWLRHAAITPIIPSSFHIWYCRWPVTDQRAVFYARWPRRASSAGHRSAHAPVFLPLLRFSAEAPWRVIVSGHDFERSVSASISRLAMLPILRAGHSFCRLFYDDFDGRCSFLVDYRRQRRYADVGVIENMPQRHHAYRHSPRAADCQDISPDNTERPSSPTISIAAESLPATAIGRRRGDRCLVIAVMPERLYCDARLLPEMMARTCSRGASLLASNTHWRF